MATIYRQKRGCALKCQASSVLQSQSPQFCHLFHSSILSTSQKVQLALLL